MTERRLPLQQLCAHLVRGAADLAELARGGRLSFSDLWVAAEGAERYVRAVAAGDVAPPEVAEERLGTCSGCPAATAGPGSLAGVVATYYCGTPFRPSGGPQATCGCLLGGKAAVASEACPRASWGPHGGTPPG